VAGLADSAVVADSAAQGSVDSTVVADSVVVGSADFMAAVAEATEAEEDTGKSESLCQASFGCEVA
jgi:hypothetical protein